MSTVSDARPLSALRSVGPAALEDLRRLGVADVEELARCNPQALYTDLCRIKGQQVDICCRIGHVPGRQVIPPVDEAKALKTRTSERGIRLVNGRFGDSNKGDDGIVADIQRIQRAQ